MDRDHRFSWAGRLPRWRLDWTSLISSQTPVGTMGTTPNTQGGLCLPFRRIVRGFQAPIVDGSELILGLVLQGLSQWAICAGSWGKRRFDAGPCARELSSFQSARKRPTHRQSLAGVRFNFLAVDGRLLAHHAPSLSPICPEIESAVGRLLPAPASSPGSFGPLRPPALTAWEVDERW
ncbi:MAG: hypothetical protein CML07_00120 [Psychrobacter sp.]|nr:hypothetical protein [Psychrobacter sp.]